MGLASRIRAGIALALLGAATAAPTAAASSQVSCTSLAADDSSGATWAGASWGLTHVAGPDAFQPLRAGLFLGDGSGPNYSTSQMCTASDDGREIDYPPETLGSTTVKAESHITVSAPGRPGYVRFLQTFTNTGTDPVTENLILEDLIANSTNWRATSSGDRTVAPGDDWYVGSDTADPNPPATHLTMAEVWSAPGGMRPSRFVTVPSGTPSAWTEGSGQHTAVFDHVTIPAGKSVSLLAFAMLRPATTDGIDSAAADAAAIAAQPAYVYEGLTTDEKNRILNWPAADQDLDGVPTAVDNCPATANADQADTDGDGIGDACDTDSDNDGLSNTVEATLGSDPLKADSDGDGVPDGSDQCIVRAGGPPTGCPLFGQVIVGGGGEGGDGGPVGTATTPADKSAPKLTVSGVKAKPKLKAFLEGVTGKATCSEACTLSLQLVGTAKKVTLARAAEVTLGSQSFSLSKAIRAFKVKPSKKLVGKAKKLKVQLRVSATDASGNATTKTVSLRVG